MKHLNQFKQNRKQPKSTVGNSTRNVQVKFEAANMEESQNAVELCRQRYSIFSAQNIETGHFDVTFLFKDEKELHAHSFILWPASEVFETMLFGAWAKKEPIPITAHSIEDFKEFLTFLYLGKCAITMDNVMALVDLAESYNIPLLKNKCDHFLMTPTPENVFILCEMLKIYSLQIALENLYGFIAINASTVLKNPSFLEAPKETVLHIVKMERLIIKEEELFDAIYKWAEYHAVDQLVMKELLADILPHIRFPIMNLEYLHKTIVPLGYLFSSLDELSDILRDAGNFHKKTLWNPASQYPHFVRKCFNLQFSDHNQNVARAYICDMEFYRALSFINHSGSRVNNNHRNADYKECYWNIAVPPKITKTDASFDLSACKLYLIRNSQGMLALKDFSPLSGKHFSKFRNRHKNESQNEINNDEDTVNESDIIARVYCDDENFLVDKGCLIMLY